MEPLNSTFNLSAPSSPRRPLLTDSSSSDFEFSGHLLPHLTLPTADELFQGGLIRPLKLPTTTNTLSKPTPLPGRGRAKKPQSKPDSARNMYSRSVSPLRVSEFALHQSSAKSPSCSSSSASSLSSSPSLKWRLKDLLLFRSASEGRSTKRSSSISSALMRCVGSNYDDDSSSFRYAIGEGEGSVSKRRSEKELHYCRADREEDKNKKKNRHSIMECVGL